MHSVLYLLIISFTDIFSFQFGDIFLGPQLDWDPDIVAGLDVDFNYDDPDNILEDDFIVRAEGPLGVGEPELAEELECVF